MYVHTTIPEIKVLHHVINYIPQKKKKKRDNVSLIKVQKINIVKVLQNNNLL